MQAPEEDREGAHGGDDGNAACGGPESPGVGGGAGEGGAATPEGPQGQGAGQGQAFGDLASASVGYSERPLKEFRLSLPFHFCLEAEMARLLLAPVAEALASEVRRQITVRGNVLDIFLSAEDAHLLEVSKETLLSRLSAILPSQEYSEP